MTDVELTTVPSLLAEVRRLRALVKAAEDRGGRRRPGDVVLSMVSWWCWRSSQDLPSLHARWRGEVMPLDPSMFTTRATIEALWPPELLVQMLVDFGPPLPPLTRWQRIRGKLRGVSLDVRYWIAVKVLRLNVGED